MIPYWQKQQLDFKIYVVEQSENTTFNRAKLFNVGYDIAKNDPILNYDCYTFHDVDLFPENEAIVDYHCKDHPGRHISAAWKRKPDWKNYEHYPVCFGGVSQVTENGFEQVNGFSNLFWGWGGEDDNLRFRLQGLGKDSIIFENHELYKFAMYPHDREESNEKPDEKFQQYLIRSSPRDWDGLKQLRQAGYKLLAQESFNCFEKFTVDIGTKVADGLF